MDTLPLQQIKALHKQYAGSKKAFQLVWQHSQIVWEIAHQLIKENKLKVDKNLVKNGCLLHDIGAYLYIDKEGNFDEENYLKHGIAGYQILLQEGLDEKLCDIAENHIGVGIAAEEIIQNKLPLPVKDYVAKTVEQRLIMYADKFHSKYPRFNSYQSYLGYTAKFSPQNPAKFEKLAKEFGVPELEPLAKKYQQQII